MLASSPKSDTDILFPVLATPKVDGIRAMLLKGKLVSRTLKPIPNTFLRQAIESALPDGCDGELVFGDTFQSSTSGVMTINGPKLGFSFYVFDFIGREGALSHLPYSSRIKMLKEVLQSSSHCTLVSKLKAVVNVIVLSPELLKDKHDLDRFEQKCLSTKFEGVIIRKPDGHYKYGRSTPKEGLLVKIKRFDDAEGIVQGFEELVHKDEKDGNHSSSKQLGALILHNKDGGTFRVGSGFTQDQRKTLWKQRSSLVGKLVKYKFFKIGMKTAPRFPTFVGFRDKEDV